MLVLFQQIAEKLVEIFLQPLHQVGVNDDRVIVNDIQFGNGFLLIVAIGYAAKADLTCASTLGAVPSP